MENNENLTQQKFYELIGEFVVEFEHICWVIRGCINAIVSDDGTNETNDNWKRITTLLSDMPARDLYSRFDSLVKDFNKVEGLGELNREVSKKFSKLCEARNELVHGNHITSFFWGQDIDPNSSESQVFHVKPKLSKSKGLSMHKVLITESYLKSLIDQARSLVFLYKLFYNGLVMYSAISKEVESFKGSSIDMETTMIIIENIGTIKRPSDLKA